MNINFAKVRFDSPLSPLYAAKERLKEGDFIKREPVMECFFRNDLELRFMELSRAESGFTELIR